MAPKKFVLPKKEGEIVDLLYRTRENRLKLQRDIDELQKQETKCKEWFIANLDKSKKTGAAGKVARVQLTTEPVPQVEDWDKFYKHIKKTGEFELLNRAVNKKSVEERWDNKKQIPGVARFNVVKVSCTKI